MAKISIEDRNSNGETLSRKILNPLLDGACRAIERLGPAANVLEIIKISPLDQTKPAYSPFVNVKLVLASGDEGSKAYARIEREFQMFCHKENTEDFLAQGVIRNFQEMVVELSNNLEKRAGQLRNTLATLGQRERDSGNDQRCRICGRIPGPDEKGKPCPQCAKCSSR